MSARRGHKKWSAHTGPNMTPMVDVVMCILIFFMLSATFAMPELYLTSNTPAVEKQGLSNTTATEQIPAVRNYIQLKRLGDQTVASAFGAPGTADLVSDTASGLPGLLKAKGQQLSKDVQIIIAPENRVPYKDVIAVYDACIAAHFEHVAFAPVH
jgi:biopolymer transport protein ExbD